MTLFILMICTAAAQSTRRVPPRNCTCYVKATFGRLFAEMTAIKEKVSDLEVDNSDLRIKVSDLEQKVNQTGIVVNIYSRKVSNTK